MEQKKEHYNRLAAGERIRSRRKKLGITRQELAAQIGRTEKYYADIERGYCGMSLETLIDIADSLGITLDYLVFGAADSEDVSEDSERLLFYLGSCDERKRRKAIELLKLYLSE